MITNTQLLETYFQKNTSYYLDKVDQYNNGQKFTFNIYAFLFGFFWFIYRKMYLEALLFIAFLFVEGTIEEIILSNVDESGARILGFIITVLIGATTGFIGNLLYINKANRTIQKAMQKQLSNDKLVEYVKSKGGVTYLFFVAIIAVIILFFIYNNYISYE